MMMKKQNFSKREDTVLEEKNKSNNTYEQTFDIIKEMNDISFYDNKKSQISHIINILDKTKEKKRYSISNKSI